MMQVFCVNTFFFISPSFIYYKEFFFFSALLFLDQSSGFRTGLVNLEETKFIYNRYYDPLELQRLSKLNNFMET